MNTLTAHTTMRIEITKSVEHGDYGIPKGEKRWVEFFINPSDYLGLNEKRFNHVEFSMNSPEFKHTVELTYEEVEKVANALLEMVRIHKNRIRIIDNNPL